MSWAWSHTEEAMRNVHQHIYRLEPHILIEVYVEWACSYKDEDGTYQLNGSHAARVRKLAEELCYNEAHDLLADTIVGRVFDLQICDNGGFNAWICPFGCHTVPFDEEEDDNE